MKRVHLLSIIISFLLSNVIVSQDLSIFFNSLKYSKKQKDKKQSELNALKKEKGDTPDKIIGKIGNYMNAYEELLKVKLSEASLDKLTNPIFTKAVGNSEGIIKNGSALSYIMDKDKSTIAINHAFFLKKYSTQVINFNFNGTSDGNYLYLLNSTKYNYGLEASMKYSRKTICSILRDPNDAKDLEKARNQELYYDLMAKYNQLLSLDSNKVKDFIKAQEDILNKDYVVNNKTKSYKYFKKQSDTLKVMQDTLKAIRTFYDLYNNDKLRDEIVDQITTFEKEKAKVNVYVIRWWDYNLGYKLLSNSIFDSTIYKFYKVSQKQFHRVTAAISYNFLLTGSSNLLYINAGVKVFNGYALENQTLSNINIIDTTGIQEYSFRAYNNLQNKNLNETYLVTNPFITAVLFPTKNKEFGMEISGEVKLYDYSAPVYDGRFGFLYSIVDKDDKDKTRSTVGIFVTLNKYDSKNPRTEDFIGMGFRVGVPFAGLFNDKK